MNVIAIFQSSLGKVCSIRGTFESGISRNLSPEQRLLERNQRKTNRSYSIGNIKVYWNAKHSNFYLLARQS
jgi:hypothetical protein